jgi:hypothetical protein
MPSVLELARSSGLIFSGTVVQRGTSTVPAVPPSSNLVVVRVDRGIRVDPVHGDIKGKLITVVPTEALAPGQRAVFFTNSWIHGQGIAVREVAHLDPGEEARAAEAVSQLPLLHLQERLQGAELVARGEVVRVSAVERKTFERNAPLWAAAELKVDRALRGKPRTSATVYFPTSDHPMWVGAPRFKERQRGIFILRAPSRNATPSEAALAADSLVALDAADVQPESGLHAVEELLGAIK